MECVFSLVTHSQRQTPQGGAAYTWVAEHSLARAAVVMSRDYAQAETFQATAAPLKAAHLALRSERERELAASTAAKC